MRILDFDRDRDATALRRFAALTWQRPSTDAYWTWWLSCPRLDGVVAYEDGPDGAEIVGVVFAIRRTYRTGHEHQSCLETFDWFVRPDRIRPGLGVLLMRRLMQRGAPMLVLGATEQGEQAVRRLGFREVADGRTYSLPLGAAPLRARGWNRAVAGLAGVVLNVVPLTWRRPRPAGAELTRVEGTPALAGSAAAARVVPEPDPAFVSWLRGAVPEVGTYLPFVVTTQGRVVLHALVRLHGSGAARVGALLEWHDAGAAPALAEWALSEVLASMVREGAQLLTVTSTDPVLHAALARRRFRLTARPPALAWTPKGIPALEPPVLMMGSRGDEAFLVV